MIEVSKPQILLFKIIRDKYPTAQLNYPIETKRGTRYLDVALPRKKICIEYDSDYWHNKLKDRKRDDELKKIGWITIRVGNVNKNILTLVKCAEIVR